MLAAAGFFSLPTLYLATGIVAALILIVGAIAKVPKVLDLWAERRTTKRTQGAKVKGLERAVATMQGDMTEVKGQVATLVSDMAEVKGKLTNGSEKSPADLLSAIAKALGVET